MSVATTLRRRRIVPIALISGVAATALLSLSMTGVLAGFTATIVNPTNTAASATFLLSEAMPSQTTCLSNVGGGAITTNANTNCLLNNYGGSTVMTPGLVVENLVTLKNEGTGAASGLTVTPGACATTQQTPHGSAASVCPKMFITIQESGATACVFPVSSSAACAATPTVAGNLGNIGTAALVTSALAGGASKLLTIRVMLDTAADNSYQGLNAAQSLTYNLIQ